MPQEQVAQLIHGCAGWHKASYQDWRGKGYGLKRGRAELFSFYAEGGSYDYLGRAAVVCGTGF